MLLLLWLVNSSEAACVARTSAEALSAQVQALIEPVAFAEDTVAAELAAIEATLRLGCLEQPVSRETLGALFMAQGAYELLRGGDPQRADALLRRAAALTTPIEPAYGPKVEEAYRAAVNGMRGDAILELSFPARPEVVLVDGEVVYDAVERRVLLGSHLVQWYSAELGWSAEWVDMNEWGERRLVGGGPPLPDDLGELPSGSDKAGRTKEPKAPRDPGDAPRVAVTGLMGYALSDAPEVTSDDLRADALGFMPTFAAEAQLGALSVSGRYSPGASPMEIPTDEALGGPAVPNELRALVILRRDQPLTFGLGLLAISQPTVSFEQVSLLTDEGDQLAVEAPSFGAVPSVGPLLQVALGGGETVRWSTSARVAWTLGAAAKGFAGSGALAGHLAVPMGPMHLILGAELGGLRAMEGQPGPWLYPQVVGGVQWSR